MNIKKLTMCFLIYVIILSFNNMNLFAATHSEIREKIISILYGNNGGRLSCDFDSYQDKNSRHEGIDFVKSRGANVYAVLDGVVTSSRTAGSNNLSTIAIYNSTYDITIIYLHSNRVISTGEYVYQGQLIATEGSYGASSPHTHVELREGKRTSASISIGSTVLDNPNPYPFWEKALFNNESNTPKPSPISGVNIREGTSTDLTFFSWNPSENATDYDIYINYTDGTPYQDMINTTKLDYAVLLPEGEYTVNIIPCNKSNGDNVYTWGDEIYFSVTNGYYNLVNKISYDGHEYLLYDNNLPWHSAKLYCEQEGGHLATITSQEEYRVIKDLVNLSKFSKVYIGGTDEGQEGAWKWVSDESFNYTAWNDGEPNNENGEEHYLCINKYSNWNDVTYNYLDTGFILEKDVAQPSPISGIKISEGTSFDLTFFSWNPSENATDYDIRIYNNDGTEYQPMVNTVKCDYAVLLPEGEYYVKIIPCNKKDGQNIYTWSDDVHFKVNKGELKPVKTIIYNGHSYSLYDNNMSWEEAQKYCEKAWSKEYGGYLVTITSQEEYEVIKNLIKESKFNMVYGGATDKDSEGNWKWVTGEKFDFTYWNKGEPNNENNEENYLIINKNSGWNDGTNNSLNTGFILEREMKPFKYSIIDGHTYEIYDTNLTWKDAEKYCEERGGHLAVITDRNRYVLHLITAYGQLQQYYIGGTDEEQEGNWKWVTGEKFDFTYWNEGEPNNQNGNENYLAINKESKRWNDVTNDNLKSGFMLELEPEKEQEQVKTPIINEAKANQGKNITILCDTDGAEIYYTTDGSTPNKYSTKYTGTININISTTIKAIAIKSNMKDSDIQSLYVHIDKNNTDDNNQNSDKTLLVKLENVTCTVGDTIDVPIKIDRNECGFSTFGIDIVYNNKILTPISISKGNIWTDTIVSNLSYSDDKIRIAGASVDNKIDNGIICYVKFKVDENIETDINIELTLEVNQLKYINNGSISNLNYVIENGNIYILANVMIGDIDGDKNITAADATEALMYYARLKTLTDNQIKAGDVDKNGELDASDATQILRKYAGFNVNW